MYLHNFADTIHGHEYRFTVLRKSGTFLSFNFSNVSILQPKLQFFISDFCSSFFKFKFAFKKCYITLFQFYFELTQEIFV